MKRYYITCIFTVLLLLFIGIPALADAVVTLKLGPSGTLSNEYGLLHGDQNYAPHSEQGVDSQLSLAGEYFPQVRGGLQFGGGIEYQSINRIEGDNNGFRYVPLYFLVRTKTKSSAGARPYLTGKLGYNLYEEENPAFGYDLRGGLYYGFGVGLLLQKNFQAELLYACNNSEADSEIYNSAIKHRYTEISLSLGYRF